MEYSLEKWYLCLGHAGAEWGSGHLCKLGVKPTLTEREEKEKGGWKHFSISFNKYKTRWNIDRIPETKFFFPFLFLFSLSNAPVQSFEIAL